MTVDEGLVGQVRSLGRESLSSVVNAALAAEVDRRARAAALDRMLAAWDVELGPVSTTAAAAAAAAFDHLDAVAVVGDRRGPRPGRRRPGAA